jgi:hypothetical protein
MEDAAMSDEWETPDWLFGLFEGWYDPCPIWAKSDNLDGLKSEWKDKTYVNPPYSDPLPWVMKAIEESRKGKRIVMLLRSDYSTEWWQRLHAAGAHFFGAFERIKFSGSKGGGKFASTLVILEPHA